MAKFKKGTGSSQVDRNRIRSAGRRAFFRKMGPGCWYCGTICTVKNFRIEHQTPLIKGGTNAADNLVVACIGCDVDKASRTVEQYRTHLQRVRGVVVTFAGERSSDSPSTMAISISEVDTDL